jgi:hypothetical protein
MTRAELNAELARLIEQLRPGGTQAHCEALRRRIAEVERALVLEPDSSSTTNRTLKSQDNNEQEGRQRYGR